MTHLHILFAHKSISSPIFSPLPPSKRSKYTPAVDTGGGVGVYCVGEYDLPKTNTGGGRSLLIICLANGGGGGGGRKGKGKCVHDKCIMRPPDGHGGESREGIRQI